MLMMRCTNKPVNKYLVVILWIFLLGLQGCTPSSTSLATRQAYNHYPQSQTTLEQIWSVTDAYVSPNVEDITLDAMDNKICFLGDNKVVPLPKKTICRESKSGQMAWEHESGIPDTIEITHNGVFVGFNNRAKIIKFDPEGNQIWERKLNSGGIVFMSFADEEIQTLTVVDDLWILDKNGNLINRISDQKIFITTPDETFIDLNGIQALDTKSGKVLWEYIDFDINHVPIFTTDKLFVLNGIGYGTAFALDRSTGILLWKVDGIIGSLAYSSKKHIVYMLTQDGDILSVDENTGEKNAVVHFSSTPFIIDGENIYEYQLAYDESENILFVSLGDSKQLFAFREKNP